MADQFALTFKAPIQLLAQDGSVKLAGSVPAQKQAAYVEALYREVTSAAGDADGGTVDFVVFDGCSPVNMTLAAWCRILETLQSDYRGVNTARMLFNVAPQLINAKTAAYAFRFRCCFNVCLAGLDDASLAELDRVRDEMARERFIDYGVQVDAAALAGCEQLAAVVERLKADGVKFVRVVGNDQVDTKVKDVLSTLGYPEHSQNLYTGSPKFAAWFNMSRVTAHMGFGVGSASNYGGERFVCTEDHEAYIAKAGLSMDIYTEER